MQAHSVELFRHTTKTNEGTNRRNKNDESRKFRDWEDQLGKNRRKESRESAISRIKEWSNQRDREQGRPWRAEIEGDHRDRERPPRPSGDGKKYRRAEEAKVEGKEWQTEARSSIGVLQKRNEDLDSWGLERFVNKSSKDGKQKLWSDKWSKEMRQQFLEPQSCVETVF